MERWIVIQANGIEDKKQYKKVISFNKSDTMSTGDAIAYLSDFA